VYGQEQKYGQLVVRTHPPMPRVDNGPDISTVRGPLSHAAASSAATSRPNLLSDSDSDHHVVDALEPPLRWGTATCSLLLCTFRVKSHDCKSVRVLVFDPRVEPEWNDAFLWRKIRRACQNNIRGWRQRIFGLKAVKSVYLLHYSKVFRPTRIMEDWGMKSDLMYAFLNPPKIKTDREWIDWVFQLKSDPENRYALEFVEDWDGVKIVWLGSIILVAISFASARWYGAAAASHRLPRGVGRSGGERSTISSTGRRIFPSGVISQPRWFVVVGI
jgi:hypothetical protein